MQRSGWMSALLNIVATAASAEPAIEARIEAQMHVPDRHEFDMRRDNDETCLPADRFLLRARNPE